MVTKKAAKKTAGANSIKCKAHHGKKANSAKKLSQFQAAIQVLARAKEPMNCRAIIEAMAARDLWTSPGGKTPEATLYASILRGLRKGKAARIAKAGRGLFRLAAKK